VAAPASDRDSADRVMMPASTGAQHEDATPENSPSAKLPAESVRPSSGVWMNPGSDQLRPLTASPANPSSSTPPAAYSGVWKRARVADSRPTPSVTGSSTAATPSAKSPVIGRMRQRRFLTATAR
jgi:hypothetical protein